MLCRLKTLFISFAFLALASLSLAQTPQSQDIPSSARAPGTFSNGGPPLIAEPPMTDDAIPDIYGPRDIDLPFYRLFHGNMNFFSEGQLNTPTGNTDVFGSENDNANQSACGIPDNAFFVSKVAIHPYFLKYADLSRYCMQDVCISFWKEDGSSDMMLKVTDICSTDPTDPTHCDTPYDIKIDRSKAKIMELLNDNANDPRILGNQYPEKIWWFFMKCWDDGLPQPAYQGNNWFTTPALPNNLNQSQVNAQKQYDNNQKAYPAKGWSTYPNGGYNTERDDTTSPPITDWTRGEDPAWAPIAGGQGWSIPGGSGSGASSPGSSQSSPSALASTVPFSNQTSSAAGTTFSTSIIPSSSNSSTPTSLSSNPSSSSLASGAAAPSSASVSSRSTSFPYTFSSAPTSLGAGSSSVEIDSSSSAATPSTTTLSCNVQTTVTVTVTASSS